MSNGNNSVDFEKLANEKAASTAGQTYAVLALVVEVRKLNIILSSLVPVAGAKKEGE